jgi:sodium transport system permease protein
VTALVVLRKELRDAVRDRRSLLSLLLFPLVGPILVALVLTQAIEQAGGAPGRVTLPTLGVEHAPALVAYLRAGGVDPVPAPAEDPTLAVRARRAALVLVIPPDFEARFRSARPAELRLVVDEARIEAQGLAHRVRRMLGERAALVGSLRLLARGVDPAIAQPIAVEVVDVSTPRQRGAVFLSILPMFVLMATFIGGMYVAADLTAGERERGSLEPLLATPARRRSLVLGKWLATAAFSAATVTLTLVGMALAFARIPVERLGMNLALGPGDLGAMLALLLPLSLFVPAAQLAVASFARTVREAGTYLSLLTLLPVLPGLVTILEPARRAAWTSLVPVLGQHLMLAGIVRGEAVTAAEAIAAALLAVAGAALCIVLTARLFDRERAWAPR